MPKVDYRQPEFSSGGQGAGGIGSTPSPAHAGGGAGGGSCFVVVGEVGRQPRPTLNVLYELEHGAVGISPYLHRALVPIPGGHRLVHACVTRVSLLYCGRLVENSSALYYSTYGGRIRVDCVEVDGVGVTLPLPGLEILTLPTVRGDLRPALEAAGWRVARGWTPPGNHGETTEVDDG